MGEVSSRASPSRKAGAPTIRDMNTTDTAREARTRNLARLRKLTIGTAALGVAATTGFGYLASMTFDGTTTTAATTAYTTAANAATTTTSTSTTSTTSSTTSSATSAPTVTSTTSTAHTSTGGS